MFIHMKHGSPNNAYKELALHQEEFFNGCCINGQNLNGQFKICAMCHLDRETQKTEGMCELELKQVVLEEYWKIMHH